MQVDVFITTNYKRPYFMQLTYKAVEAAGFKPLVIEKPMLERYFEAEKQAYSDIYILIDDDIIPATKDTLKKLVETMRAHPELSQLGLGWRSDMRGERDSSWKLGEIGDDVWEFDHCGGCVAIRKGTIKDLGYKCDYENGIGDDKIVAKIARERGFKVGVAHKLYFHHLGAQFSTVW